MNQLTYGEYRFNWPEHPRQLVRSVLQSLRQYQDEGSIRNIIAEPRYLYTHRLIEEKRR